MADTLKASQISPIALLLLGIMVVFALVFVGGQKLAGVEPAQVETAAIVDLRAIRFVDREDGSIAAFDQGAAQPFDVIAPQTGGFLRGTLRGMARARKLAHESSMPPMEIIHWADGRLSLRDPQTKREIALEPFGPTNADAFKRLLTVNRIKS